VLGELLQGFAGPKAGDQIIKSFNALPHIVPDKDAHIGAAMRRNKCRRCGLHAGTIGALLAQLCIERQLEMLSTHRDFTGVATHLSLKLWSPQQATSKRSHFRHEKNWRPQGESNPRRRRERAVS
jgi:hypothetical protein